MSGAYKQPKPFNSGWTVHEKRSGGQYDKYDNQHAVIVGSVKKGKPHTLYFSRKSFEEMGKPNFIEVRFDGTSVGFFPVLDKDAETNPNAYRVQFSGESSREEADKTNGRAMLSARTVIAEYSLESGAYNASVYIDGSTHVIVINSNDRPSRV